MKTEQTHNVNETEEHEYDFMNTMSDADVNLIINTVNKDYQKTLKETLNYSAKNQTLTEHFDYDQNLHIHRIKIRLKVNEFNRL